MEKINGRKLSLIFIFILILLVIALLVGKFTYSYLGPTISDDLETQGEVTASGDTLIFTKGNNLSLSATTDNFTTGGTNLTSTTNPKVKLVASTKTNQASATYYVGVLIKNNTYVYTTSGKTPGLILTIKDEKGNNVTAGVNGLTYVTSGGVSGFDVTGKKGLFNIKTDYPISTTSSSAGTTHTWTFTLTFVNLGTDQSDNENASMNVDIYLQKEEYKLPLNEYVISQYTGTQGENSLYYHNSSLTNGAGDNSYRYAGASNSVNNYICLGSDEAICPDANLFRIIGVFGAQAKVIRAKSVGNKQWHSPRFRKGQYILMHSVIYRTKLLRECGLELPKHTFYVDNIYVYKPLPSVKTLYYMDVDFYRYFIGREDQSVNEKVMISRIDQQINVNKIMVDEFDLWKIPNRKLRHYMFNYLEIITVISTIMLIRSGTEENLLKKRELWKYIKDQDIRLFHHLRAGIMGNAMNLPGKGGRKISVAAYRLSQKVVGFN